MTLASIVVKVVEGIALGFGAAIGFALFSFVTAL